ARCPDHGPDSQTPDGRRRSRRTVAGRRRLTSSHCDRDRVCPISGCATWANRGRRPATCAGPCATAWPPLTVANAATAGAGVTAGMLATTNRADGTTQVTYAGHPLYYFAGDGPRVTPPVRE